MAPLEAPKSWKFHALKTPFMASTSIYETLYLNDETSFWLDSSKVRESVDFDRMIQNNVDSHSWEVLFVLF